MFYVSPTTALTGIDAVEKSSLEILLHLARINPTGPDNMQYYISRYSNSMGEYSLIWEVGATTAIRYGVPNARNEVNCYFEVALGEDIFDAVRCGLGDPYPLMSCEFFRTDLMPGNYYPRMTRPQDYQKSTDIGFYPAEESSKNFIAVALSQLNVLTRQLENICQVIHPTEATFDTYGHAVRNLLILACTEVETHWRGVLVENGVEDDDFSFATRHYVLLSNAMKLTEYSVSFSAYPWLHSIAPFANWSPERPTESIPWYSAYNAVKHKRESRFEEAKLVHAFHAVAACAIMMVAQFGENFEGWKNSDASRFFNFNLLPEWQPGEIYTADYQSLWLNKGRADWVPINYPFPRAANLRK